MGPMPIRYLLTALLLIAMVAGGYLFASLRDRAEPTLASAPSTPTARSEARVDDGLAEPPTSGRRTPTPALECATEKAGVDAEGPAPTDEVQPQPVDERKLDLIRDKLTKLEDLIASDDGLNDRRTWSLVRNMIGPVYSCALDRQGRSEPLERAREPQSQGGVGVPSREEEVLYLGFDKAYRIRYADFPELEEIVNLSSHFVGGVPDHLAESLADSLDLNQQSLAEVLGNFVARTSAELN